MVTRHWGMITTSAKHSVLYSTWPYRKCLIHLSPLFLGMLASFSAPPTVRNWPSAIPFVSTTWWGCDTSSIQYVSHVVSQSHITVPLTNAGLQSSNMSNTKNIWSTYDDRRQIMLPMLWRSSNTNMWTHGLSRMHIDSTSKPVMWHRLYVNITCEATIQYWRACIPCSRCTVRFHIH